MMGEIPLGFAHGPYNMRYASSFEYDSTEYGFLFVASYALLKAAGQLAYSLEGTKQGSDLLHSRLGRAAAQSKERKH